MPSSIPYLLILFAACIHGRFAWNGGDAFARFAWHAVALDPWNGGDAFARFAWHAVALDPEDVVPSAPLSTVISTVLLRLVFGGLFISSNMAPLVPVLVLVGGVGRCIRLVHALTSLLMSKRKAPIGGGAAAPAPSGKCFVRRRVCPHLLDHHLWAISMFLLPDFPGDVRSIRCHDVMHGLAEEGTLLLLGLEEASMWTLFAPHGMHVCML